MSEIFKVVLSLSVSGSILLSLLFFLLTALKNKVSKRWQYYIYLLVIARLLLPFTPAQSPVGSLFQGAPAAGVVSVPQVGQIPNGQDADMSGTMPAAPQASPTAETPAQPDGVAALTLLGWVWLTVALLVWVHKLTAYRAFVQALRAGSRAVEDTALLDTLARMGQEMGIRRPIELSTNSLVASPLLFGLLRPHILLPTADLECPALLFTLRHELTHCRRWDILYKWLAELTLCLHWFNPLVWRMRREIDRLCELSCDEAVLRPLTSQERTAYGDTLLRVLQGGGPRLSLPAAPLSESGKRLKERLQAISDFQRTSGRFVLLSALLAVLLTVGAAAAGGYAGPAGPGAAPVPATGDVPSADGPGLSSTGQNAAQAAAGFALLSQEEQQSYLERAYAENRLDLFSACVYLLDSDSPLVAELAEKAYTQGEIAFFSVLAGRMSEEALHAYQIRADADEKVSFQALLYDLTGQSQALEALKEKQEARQLQEYREHGIDREGKTYTFWGQPVHIFLDSRPDRSFCVLNIDPQGRLDILVLRDQDGQIQDIRPMTEAESAAILADLEEPDGEVPEEADDDEGGKGDLKENEGEIEGAVHLQVEELPYEVLSVLQGCAAHTWYLIRTESRQYIWYDGFSHSFGYRLTQTAGAWQVEIQRLSQKEGEEGYILLALPAGPLPSLTLEGEAISYTTLESGGAGG